jgi:hypothetical protein
MNSAPPGWSRRRFLGTAAFGAAAALAAPVLAQSEAATTEFEQDPNRNFRRNASSFRSLQWQPYFSDTKNGAILVDITSRALHFWSEDQTIYRLYPTSVPLTDDLTRRGPNSFPGATRKTRSGPSRCIFHGSITASTAPMTRARSDAVRRTAASVFTTNISPNSSALRRSERRCC